MTSPDPSSLNHFIWVLYSWKGEQSWRRCVPLNIECKEQEAFGPDSHWLLHVLMEDRDFARRSLLMKNIRGIRDGGPSPWTHKESPL